MSVEERRNRFHKSASYIVAWRPNGTYKDTLQAKQDAESLEQTGWHVSLVEDANYPGALEIIGSVFKKALGFRN